MSKYLVLALRLRAIQGHALQTATIQTIYLGLALTYLLLTVGITVVLIVYYYLLIMRDVNILESTAVNWTVQTIFYSVPVSTIVILCVAFFLLNKHDLQKNRISKLRMTA